MENEQVNPQQKPEDQERFFAVLGYFAFLFLVTLVAKPKSTFCQFHAKQSMVMFLTTFFVLIILAAIPMIGSLFTLALFALYVVAIYRTYNGDLWRIPFISGVADKINLSFLYVAMEPSSAKPTVDENKPSVAPVEGSTETPTAPDTEKSEETPGAGQ